MSRAVQPQEGPRGELHGARVLVTGATGFLGGHVAERLRGAGAEVIAHGRSDRLDGFAASGLDTARADISDRDATCAIFAQVGPEFVVHCAAKSAPFGPRAEFERANVDGTENVVRASRLIGVRGFVHISTPSVYCSGQPLRLVREDAPLPRHAINHYAATKREAESLITGVPSVILRPRAIFGPGDTALFPRLLRALEGGRLPIIGDGKNIVDLTYVDNVAQCIERALERLRSDPNSVNGHTYNVTNGESIHLWDLIGELAQRFEKPKPRKRIPYGVARKIAGLSEGWHRATRSKGEPRLTRYSVDSLALDATLDIGAARGDLGYEPEVGMSEGVERFVASVKAP